MKVLKFIQSYYVLRIKTLALISKRKAARLAFDIFCWPYTRVKYSLPEFFRKAEQLELEFDQLITKGYRWNKGGSKKIYIAHGFRSSAVNFGHFAKKLAAKGFEVIAFDGPAHGLSQGNRITALAYKNFIHAVDEKYGPFDGYVTHSFGGLASSLVVSEIPGNGAKKLVLIAPASDTRSLCEVYFTQMKMTDKQLQQCFFEEIERIGGHPVEWFSIKRCMHHIKGDVLWVHDTTDKITPVSDAHDVQQKALHNVRFEFTDGLGHRRIYRDENVVNMIVEFFDEWNFVK